jgi:hypothetical protein
MLLMKLRVISPSEQSDYELVDALFEFVEKDYKQSFNISEFLGEDGIVLNYDSDAVRESYQETLREHLGYNSIDHLACFSHEMDQVQSSGDFENFFHGMIFHQARVLVNNAKELDEEMYNHTVGSVIDRFGGWNAFEQEYKFWSPAYNGVEELLELCTEEQRILRERYFICKTK